MKINEIIKLDKHKRLIELLYDHEVVTSAENIYFSLFSDSARFTVPPHKIYPADSIYEMIELINMLIVDSNKVALSQSIRLLDAALDYLDR